MLGRREKQPKPRCDGRLATGWQYRGSILLVPGQLSLSLSDFAILAMEVFHSASWVATSPKVYYRLVSHRASFSHVFDHCWCGDVIICSVEDFGLQFFFQELTITNNGNAESRIVHNTDTRQHRPLEVEESMAIPETNPRRVYGAGRPSASHPPSDKDFVYQRGRAVCQDQASPLHLADSQGAFVQSI